KVFEFKSIQDISVVAGLHEQLKKLFSHKKVIMDVSNIERIDTASLQVLYAFIEEVKVNDVEIAWRSPSEAMITSVRLLGMEEVLQLDNVA
ncbi:MAG: STAS domain-containing protein, partial [Gammaproteobacteria bacterium]|nr:STAS domain-containing protein [Gammaproteobacteria bacterium]